MSAPEKSHLAERGQTRFMNTKVTRRFTIVTRRFTIIMTRFSLKMNSKHQSTKRHANSLKLVISTTIKSIKIEKKNAISSTSRMSRNTISQSDKPKEDLRTILADFMIFYAQHNSYSFPKHPRGSNTVSNPQAISK